MEVLSQELGFRPTYLKDVVGELEQPLRINNYPKCPQPELVLGLQGHTDPHMLTALLQDGTPGLQIQKGGKWVGVDPDVEAIVVSVGDQLQVGNICAWTVHSRFELNLFVQPITKPLLCLYVSVTERERRCRQREKGEEVHGLRIQKTQDTFAQEDTQPWA